MRGIDYRHTVAVAAGGGLRTWGVLLRKRSGLRREGSVDRTPKGILVELDPCPVCGAEVDIDSEKLDKDSCLHVSCGHCGWWWSEECAKF